MIDRGPGGLSRLGGVFNFIASAHTSIDQVYQFAQLRSKDRVTAYQWSIRAGEVLQNMEHSIMVVLDSEGRVLQEGHGRGTGHYHKRKRRGG